MNYEQLVERYSPFIKQNYIPLSLGIFGLIFLGYGLISLLTSSNSSNEILFESGTASEDTKMKPAQIVIDIGGAVLKAGVYSLPAGSRVHDGLIMAGGLSAEADREWVAKNLNMAMKLTDGAKIYIPRSGESIIPLRSAMQNFAGQAGTTGQVNINTASEQELDSLSGVGPVTAQKIINNRPYTAIEDLVAKKVVGSKVFGQIKEKITVY